jgi:hypothetical protein
MTDHEFLTAFETGDYHLLAGFPHAAHIRLAWLYLRDRGWDEGTRKIREGIQKLAIAHGATRKYHETVTLFWAHVVNIHIVDNPHIADFAQFAERNPRLFDKSLINLHYSPETLWSENARRDWVEPDLRPLVVPH